MQVNTNWFWISLGLQLGVVGELLQGTVKPLGEQFIFEHNFHVRVEILFMFPQNCSLALLDF